jgi:hypothetical protein
MRTEFDLIQLSASAVRSPMAALARPSFKVIIRISAPRWDRHSSPGGVDGNFCLCYIFAV